jgi:hypothetical protein
VNRSWSSALPALLPASIRSVSFQAASEKYSGALIFLPQGPFRSTFQAATFNARQREICLVVRAPHPTFLFIGHWSFIPGEKNSMSTANLPHEPAFRKKIIGAACRSAYVVRPKLEIEGRSQNEKTVLFADDRLCKVRPRLDSCAASYKLHFSGMYRPMSIVFLVINFGNPRGYRLPPILPQSSDPGFRNSSGYIDLLAQSSYSRNSRPKNIFLKKLDSSSEGS